MGATTNMEQREYYPDSNNHLFGTAQGAGTAILTLLGGCHPQTQSLG